MLIFLKLGGSILTDKNRRETARYETIRRIAVEVGRALASRDDLSLVIGHGSGSYGHFAASEYGVHLGHLEDWRGFAITSAAAARLDRLIADEFLQAGVPVVSLQPSASAHCENGELVEMAWHPVRLLLDKGLIPLVYGDVAWDSQNECTIISTEQILVYLAQHVRPRRIIMVGEVPGVMTADPHIDPHAVRLPLISSANFAEVRNMLGGSGGVDVTGGMLGKVASLYRLIEEQRDLTVRFVSGQRPGVIEKALLGQGHDEGTLMQWHSTASGNSLP